MSLADVVGILGFVLALSVFLLTRMERRKTLLVELRSDHSGLFRDEHNDPERGVFLIRFVNTSGRVILLDSDTITIHSDEKSYSVGSRRGDWWGLQQPPGPLAPGESCQVGLDLEDLEWAFDLEDMSTADVPIAVSVEDATGKEFRSRERYAYIPAVGELERRKGPWRSGLGGSM